MLSTLDLLKKYDVPGPRYTSYPTVPAWTENVGVADYQKNLSAVQAGESLSLYFHIPFCEKLCHFCGCFQIITKDHTRSVSYVEALIQEIKTVAGHLTNEVKPVSQIHFGGGTPNFIAPEELSRILSAVRDHFQILPDAEIAIEMHPRTSTSEFCQNLKKEGFNRISLGVQDFDDDVQRLINRFQTYDRTRAMMTELRSLDFKNFNLDLIYGLPGQTEEKFAKTLELTLSLKPDRLAIYSYAHVPWVRPVQRSFADSDLPTPETKLKLFERAHHFFTSQGYAQIGLDHFATREDELYQALERGGLHRNFMGYSTRADAHQIGFGVSAISYVNGHYFQNEKKMDWYQEKMTRGDLATYRGYLLDEDDRIRRNLITELMCRLQVDKNLMPVAHFDHYFAREVEKLKPFVADNLVIVTPKEIRVTERGKLTLRNIAMCFDAHLERVRQGAKTPVFSRTV